MARITAKQLVADAKAAGCEVREGNPTLIVRRRHKRTGKVLCGVLIWEGPFIIDATVDLSLAKRMTIADAARMLDLTSN